MGERSRKLNKSLVPGHRTSKWWSHNSDQVAWLPSSLHGGPLPTLPVSTTAGLQSSDLTQVLVSSQEFCLEARRVRYVIRPQHENARELLACLKRETMFSSHGLWAFNGAELLDLVAFFRPLKPCLSYKKYVCKPERLLFFTSWVATFWSMRSILTVPWSFSALMSTKACGLVFTALSSTKNAMRVM